jgi:hypothetical protein
VAVEDVQPAAVAWPHVHKGMTDLFRRQSVATRRGGEDMAAVSENRVPVRYDSLSTLYSPVTEKS